MATYNAPVSDIQFVLNDVLNINQLTKFDKFQDATPDMVESILYEAKKFCENELAPMRQANDEQGCVHNGSTVIYPDGVEERYKAYSEAGWMGLASDPEWGGQGLPYTLSKAVEEMVCGANVSFALVPGLTGGAFEAIEASASQEVKETYLEKMCNGEWTGTMNLTEPQAGTDLGAVKTTAVDNGDGSFNVTGGKIFISGGDHEMTDNVVHFVLARLSDAPAGVRGLTTFVVPKFKLDANGNATTERNGVKPVSIEEKMGIHGSGTCTMSFEDAQGWMVGAPGQGIQNMFIMMNKARIMVGFQGLGLCELATQNAIAYAKDRKQGKGLKGGDEIAIIEHPDVRRMLLTMKAVTEGSRVLAYETAICEDIKNGSEDPAEREAASDWFELGTPLTKAFCTDQAFELGSTAVQVYGGHGFISEHGIEQIIRDAKILALYEGTNGVQAMDLARRKLLMKGGALPKAFFARVDACVAEAGDDVDYLTAPMLDALAQLKEATTWMQTQFMADGEPDNAGSGAVPYLRAFSLVYLGYAWIRMAQAAQNHPDADFKEAKLATAKFFAARMLPEVKALCADAMVGGDTVMALAADKF